MQRLRDLITLFRPKHWAKNVFVFMPVPFALAWGATFSAGRFSLGLLGFCLANSAVYALNDAQDAAQDREHPTKRNRPVAAGCISPGIARLWSVLLFVAANALAYGAAGTVALTIVLTYGALNLAYSLGVKNVPLLDVFILSSGFVLRVLFGCALVGVQPSNWLLLCSSALALFLALAKRRADLAQGLGVEQRPSLAGYTLPFLDQAIGISAGMTLIAYALYCRDATVLTPGREFASLPFVLFGVLDYLRVAHLKNEGGNPVDLILSSPSLLFSGVGWALATIWSVGISWPG
jgi:4-hydroxybenzoate polyprenyltransferase